MAWFFNLPRSSGSLSNLSSSPWLSGLLFKKSRPSSESENAANKKLSIGYEKYLSYAFLEYLYITSLIIEKSMTGSSSGASCSASMMNLSPLLYL